jgi:hypothetical protein
MARRTQPLLRWTQSRIRGNRWRRSPRRPRPMRRTAVTEAMPPHAVRRIAQARAVETCASPKLAPAAALLRSFALTAPQFLIRTGCASPRAPRAAHWGPTEAWDASRARAVLLLWGVARPRPLSVQARWTAGHARAPAGTRGAARARRRSAAGTQAAHVSRAASLGRTAWSAPADQAAIRPTQHVVPSAHAAAYRPQHVPTAVTHSTSAPSSTIDEASQFGARSLRA